MLYFEKFQTHIKVEEIVSIVYAHAPLTVYKTSLWDFLSALSYSLTKYVRVDKGRVHSFPLRILILIPLASLSATKPLLALSVLVGSTHRASPSSLLSPWLAGLCMWLNANRAVWRFKHRSEGYNKVAGG